MKRLYINRKEMIRKVAKSSKVSQPIVKQVMDAIGDVIFEESRKATYDDDVTIILADGVHYGTRKVKEYVVRDPRNGTYSDKGEQYVPYIKFLPTFRDVLNKRREKADYHREGIIYSSFMKRFEEGGAFEALKKED